LHLRQVAFRLIGLAILIVILLQLDLRATLATVAEVRWGFLLLALAADPLQFGLKSLRWQKLLQMQGIRYPAGDAFLAFMAGLFLGLVTPGRVGEMGKALYLKQDQDLPVSEGLANVLMDRLFDLYTISILGTVGLIRVRLLPTWTLALIAAGTVSALLMPLALLSKRLAGWGIMIMGQLPLVRVYQDRVSTATSRFQNGLRPLLSPALVMPLLLTALAYTVFFSQAWLLSQALALDIGIAYLAVCLSVAGIITLLPISFSGLGTRDAILILLFAPLGLIAEQAVAYSTLFFLTFYVGGGIMGAIAWQIKPLAKRPKSHQRGTG
jgi:uncharacterized protein (TIRG00374 family)